MKLGMIYTVWEVLANFLMGKGQIFGPMSGLGKFLVFPYLLVISFSHSMIHEHLC